MDYRGIFTPLAQPSGPWRGQSLSGPNRAPEPPAAPAVLRAHIFFDGQNHFRAVKARFGYTYSCKTRLGMAGLHGSLDSGDSDFALLIAPVPCLTHDATRYTLIP